MKGKKKLIRRMATAATITLVLGVVGAGVTTLITRERRDQEFEHFRRQRLEAVEVARTYLGELAQRITSVPVDPTIVGEVQARYFEDISQGARFVWATGADGAFLFGVPREDFARLNGAWDTHEASIAEEGVFVDRQDFLMRLVHLSENLDQTELSPDPADPEDTPWAGLRRHAEHHDLMVFSAPLATPDGEALGNLFLKMAPPTERRNPWAHHPSENLIAIGAVTGSLSGLFLWFLVPTWVYVDARERGVLRALLWSFLAFIAFPIGLVVYLIARPEAVVLKCPGCEREVNGGGFCPHCGRDLSRAFCATCRYPLESDWAYCPSCRTEVRPPAGETDDGAVPSTAEGS